MNTYLSLTFLSVLFLTTSVRAQDLLVLNQNGRIVYQAHAGDRVRLTFKDSVSSASIKGAIRKLGSDSFTVGTVQVAYQDISSIKFTNPLNTVAKGSSLALTAVGFGWSVLATYFWINGITTQNAVYLLGSRLDMLIALGILTAAQQGLKLKTKFHLKDKYRLVVFDGGDRRNTNPSK